MFESRSTCELQAEAVTSLTAFRLCEPALPLDASDYASPPYPPSPGRMLSPIPNIESGEGGNEGRWKGGEDIPPLPPTRLVSEGRPIMQGQVWMKGCGRSRTPSSRLLSPTPSVREGT